MLGTPNWFNTMAPPVAAFLAAHDFTGKTILPFCTNGGGGMGHILKDVKKLASGAAVRDGLEVYEGGLTAAGEKTAAWLKKNDLGRK